MNPNEPAFPTPNQTFTDHLGEQGILIGDNGCSKRELFAALALMGLLANPKSEPEDVVHNKIIAVRNADGLIEQLNLDRSPDGQTTASRASTTG